MAGDEIQAGDKGTNCALSFFHSLHPSRRVPTANVTPQRFTSCDISADSCAYMRRLARCESLSALQCLRPVRERAQ
jgi:hypothetical protein